MYHCNVDIVCQKSKKKNTIKIYDKKYIGYY